MKAIMDAGTHNTYAHNDASANICYVGPEGLERVIRVYTNSNAI